MELLKTIEKMICANKTNSIKYRHLCLAYLALHIQNPGLHPDDAMYNGSGYVGWQAVLVDRVLSTSSKIPDTFHYPYLIGKLKDILKALPCTPIEELGMINSILDWLEEDMKPSELDSIVTMLQSLYLYYASENDSAEEAEKPAGIPAGILKYCADVLNWILQQH